MEPPTVPLLRQFTAKAPEKAPEDGLSHWASAIHVQDLNGVLSSQLQPLWTLRKQTQRKICVPLHFIYK